MEENIQTTPNAGLDEFIDFLEANGIDRESIELSAEVTESTDYNEVFDSVEVDEPNPEFLRKLGVKKPQSLPTLPANGEHLDYDKLFKHHLLKEFSDVEKIELRHYIESIII